MIALWSRQSRFPSSLVTHKKCIVAVLLLNSGGTGATFVIFGLAECCLLVTVPYAFKTLPLFQSLWNSSICCDLQNYRSRLCSHSFPFWKNTTHPCELLISKAVDLNHRLNPSEGLFPRAEGPWQRPPGPQGHTCHLRSLWTTQALQPLWVTDSPSL